jgi:hypothetical protein
MTAYHVGTRHRGSAKTAIASICRIATGMFLMTATAHSQISVTGPIAGTPLLILTPGVNFDRFDLAASGYVAEEWFIAGKSTSYKPVGQTRQDGKWQVEPAATAPYTTRIVVVRPMDASKFNGTVVVEWLNVSLGAELAADWDAEHRELIRGGFAYVGVSAQQVGIDGGSNIGPSGMLPLRKADPARYGPLNHPGDAFAYDIFSQAGRVVRGADGAKVLGPLVAKRLLVTGESQSAIFLTTYVNAFDPVAKVYDGYLIHSRFGAAASIDGASVFGPAPAGMPATVNLRANLRVPVMTIITETDLFGVGPLAGFHAAQQPDTDRLRIWEIAGTAHSDTYQLNVAHIDSGSTPVAQLAAAYAANNPVLGPQPKPINSAPQHHYVVMAALSSLDRWVRDGSAPPNAPRIKMLAADKPGSMPTLVLDARGNVEGGIRTPWVDVPTARLSGLGNPGTAGSFGLTEVFDQSTLDNLYRAGRAEYLKKFDESLESTIKSGFLLRADAAEILALAAAMYPGSR